MWAKVLLLFEIALDQNSRRMVEIIWRGRIFSFGGAHVNFLYTYSNGHQKNFGGAMEPSGSAPAHYRETLGSNCEKTQGHAHGLKGNCRWNSFFFFFFQSMNGIWLGSIDESWMVDVCQSLDGKFQGEVLMMDF